MFDVFCVTNRHLCEGNFLSRVKMLAELPIQGIILREKDLTEEEYLALAEDVIKICKEHNIPCILHNFVSVAQKLHWKSIHLPLPVLRTLSARERAEFTVLGVSCHSLEEAVEAERLGCTYVIAGHIFQTDCKPGVPARGISFLDEVCEAVTIPVYGIGGINQSNLTSVAATKAKGVCIMSEFMHSKHPENIIEAGKIFSKETLLLYAVTDRSFTGTKTLYEQVEAALQGGVTCVQLREKDCEEQVFIKEAIEMRKLCYKYKVPLIINDNLNVAIASNADGIHVGQEDCPVSEIRKRMGSHFIIGATAKTVEQAQKAEAQGADYLGVGAVFPSPTKTTAIRISQGELKQICSSVSIPAVAIGGIDSSNISELFGCGIAGVALVSAIFGAKDIMLETRNLKEKAIKLIRKE